MLKRIGIEHVRLGMFVHEFCGSWMEHPFWRTAFLLTNPADLKKIQECSIKELWIDTGKGLDVEAGIAKEESDAKTQEELLKATAQKPSFIQRVSMALEARKAAKICAKSKEAVASMFQEARMGKAINAQDAMPLVEEISASVERNPGALISLARLKNADDYTYMHSVAVCALMIALARQLKLDEEQTRAAGMAGLLHDVGKMWIPLNVLNKPGKLTDEEFDLVKSHPMAGFKALQEGQNVHPIALDVCLHHHEKTDGSGYPKGLKDEEISLFAKMGAVCDVYDAITSNRPYKAGWDPAESIKRMAEWSKGHFDEKVFQAFVKSLGIYPTGSLVRLESGRLAVVVEQTEKSLLTPIVRAFFSLKSNAFVAPELIDLSRSKDKIVGREDPAKFKFKNMEQLWMQ